MCYSVLKALELIIHVALVVLGAMTLKQCALNMLIPTITRIVIHKLQLPQRQKKLCESYCVAHEGKFSKLEPKDINM